VKPALEAVIFDVDGTLVDSERDGHRVVFNLAFEEAGLPDRWDVPTYGRLLLVTGGRQRLAQWFRSQGRTDEQAQALAVRLHARKTEIMRGLVATGQIAARPGVEELLDSLAAAGVPAHVATTGTREWVEPLLDRLFGGRFGVVVTGTEVPDLKPSPAAYQEVLRRTGLGPAGVVAVEDSANGLTSALAAGLSCVVVSNDYTSTQDFSGASLVTASFTAPELIAWF
jgi:HAD superfamily hydrolase (TIGR01509 family)